MEQAYAQALIRAVEAGKSPHDAVHAVAQALKRSGRSELLPRIKRAVARMSERAHANTTRVYVAHENDGHAAIKSAGVAHADIRIDKTLIGGWRLEEGEKLIDSSFKKMLLDIYNKAVTAN